MSRPTVNDLVPSGSAYYEDGYGPVVDYAETVGKIAWMALELSALYDLAAPAYSKALFEIYEVYGDEAEVTCTDWAADLDLDYSDKSPEWIATKLAAEIGSLNAELVLDDARVCLDVLEMVKNTVLDN